MPQRCTHGGACGQAASPAPRNDLLGIKRALKIHALKRRAAMGRYTYTPNISIHMAACHFKGGRPDAIAFLHPARGFGAGWGTGREREYETSMVCGVTLKHTIQ